MKGFEAKYRLSGAGFTIKQVLAKGTAALTKGDMVTLGNTGEVALGTPTAVGFLGVCLGSYTSRVAATRVPVITDDDVVYGVVDANVRKIGDTLSLTGVATGTQGAAPGASKEFIVVEDSRADEATKVRFNVGKHFYNTAH